MTATIGMQLRLEPELHEAIDRVVPRGSKTEYIKQLIRRDLTRRGELNKPTSRRPS